MDNVTLKSEHHTSVSVIISTWRRRSLLRRLLFSIARQKTLHVMEIIVADSNSNDGTAWLIERFSRRVRSVTMVQTYNALAAKRNAGAIKSRGKFLIFLDDDLLLENKTAIDAVVKEAMTENRPICFRVQYPADWLKRSNYYRFKQISHDLTNSGPRRLSPFRFVAMAFCMERVLYDRIGGFSEKFKTYGGEDHAFDFAMRRLGIEPILSRTAHVLHCETSSSLEVYLRRKIVVMVRDTFPVLLSDYPECRPHLKSQFLESFFAIQLIRALPMAVFEAMLVATACLMDRIPYWLPKSVLRLIGRAGLLVAYCVGIRSRA